MGLWPCADGARLDRSTRVGVFPRDRVLRVGRRVGTRYLIRYLADIACYLALESELSVSTCYDFEANTLLQILAC